MPPARPARISWDKAAPKDVVLLLGPEDLLAERATERIVAALLQQAPDLEESQLSASGYVGGQLAQACSPSLFAADRCVTLDGLEQAGDAAITEALAYLKAPEPDVTLLLRHRGGNRGKKLIDAVAAAGYPIIGCDQLKRESDKESFAAREFVRAGRKIESQAMRAVVEALGGDLRELAAGCAQLMADTEGTITKEMVDTYYLGRVEVTGFKVADAALSGDTAGALVLVRHAFASGVEPVPIVAAIAAKLRTLAKVAGARRRGLDPVADLGLPGWQVERAQRELRAWDPARLAAAIKATAKADSEVKGESRAPYFALERAVIAVSQAARPARR